MKARGRGYVGAGWGGVCVCAGLIMAGGGGEGTSVIHSAIKINFKNTQN